MLTWEYPPRIVGGISKVVYDLSQRLTKDGHEVHVVTYLDGDAKPFEKDKDVFVHRVSNYMIASNNFIDWVLQLNFNMLAKANELIAKDGKFDVIHAHDWLTAYAAKSLKDSYNIPLTCTIHATEAGRNSGIHTDEQKYINDTEWMLTYESMEVIVNSNYMKNELQRLFSLPFDKINVIPNGVNLTKFNKINRDYDFRRRFAADNEKIIFFAGRLVPEKGVQTLIGALPKIIENYNDVKLIVAGEGGMLEELRTFAYNIGVAHKVYFTGKLNSVDMVNMYKAADVAVFPSTYEPFGIVAIEAMLSGTPTVVSDIGGLNEIVDHGVNGMKFYTGNINSLADSILSILYNPKLAADLTKNAKAKVKEKYNWASIADNTHFVYEKAISQTVAQRKAYQKEQNEALSKKKKSTKEVTNLINFKSKQAYA